LRYTKNKPKATETDQEETAQSDVGSFLSMLADDMGRTIGLYGEVNGDNCKSLVAQLYAMKNSAKYNIAENGDEELDSCEPMEMIISTEGGHVNEMFAVYDVMRQVKKQCEIHTIGLGKVMSAGVLLLAAGTKGKRTAGSSCRLMIHSISGGDFGSIGQLENNIKEVKWHQNKFVEALAHHSDLSPRQIKSLLRKKSDTYFDATQALKWGIIDEIF